MRNLILMTALRSALTTDATDGGATAPINVAELANEAEKPESAEEKQARKARLDLAREQAAKAANDGTAMPPELLGLAQQEIQICWKEFAGKDGVFDALKRARKGLSNISAHILTIAKACAAEAFKRAESQGPDFDVIKLAGAMFRNAMAAAESSLRGSLDLTDDDAEERLDEFLKSSWKVYQSQAKQGFDAGLDPRDYDSLYAIKNATKAAKEAKATGTRTDKAEGVTLSEAIPDATPDGTEPQGQAADADAAGETEEETGDDTSDDQELADGSEVDIISQGSAPIRMALILLHRAVHAVDTEVDNHEERVVNILRMATREINKLTMDSEELEQVQGETDLTVAEG